MNKTFSALLATAAIASILGSSPAAQAMLCHNGLTGNGIGLNGVGTNGVGTNGIGLNGMGTNGIGLNGMSSNGLMSNGVRRNGTVLQGEQANGLRLNGKTPQGLFSNGIGVQAIRSGELNADGGNPDGEKLDRSAHDDAAVFSERRAAASSDSGLPRVESIRIRNDVLRLR